MADYLAYMLHPPGIEQYCVHEVALVCEERPADETKSQARWINALWSSARNF
jgi:hypothetical protein